MDKVERIHFSQITINQLLQRDHYGKTHHDQIKPYGFWYSIGDAWHEWCESEMPHWKGEHRYAVDVSKANVLYLPTVTAIREFNHEFGHELYPGTRSNLIDWGAVAERWDGIEINPYHWSIRMDSELLWYYGWDVPSGCVWNVDQVTLTPL